MIKSPPDEVDASTLASQRPFPSFSGAVQSEREYLKWYYCEKCVKYLSGNIMKMCETHQGILIIKPITSEVLTSHDEK